MKFWFGKKDAAQGGAGEGECDVLTIEDRDAVTGVTHSSSVLIAPQQGQALTGGGGIVAQTLTTAAKPAQQERVSTPPKPAPQQAQAKPPVPAAGGAEVQKAATGGVPPQAASSSVGQERKEAVVPVAAGKGAVVIGQAPMNLAKTNGAQTVQAAGSEAGRPPRPVLTPVRMAAQTEPIKLKPLTAPVATAVAAPAMGAAALAGGARPGPGFGLRPKDGVATIGPAAPMAVASGMPAQKPVLSAAVAAEQEKGGAVERDADSIVRPKTDQRALYYQLMNGLYDAVLILDDQGHIVDCNARVTAMLGYAREDTWDLPIGKVITGMSSQMFEHLKRNLAENHHILIDARCFRQDGTSFAGEVGVSTLSLTKGSNIVFAIRNVDRRKNAMDEMRKGQAALEASLAPSFVCDMDGFFLVVNRALLEAFGIPDEAQSKNIRFIDLLPDAARFFLRASCGEKLRESLRVPTPNGIPLKVELALQPVQNGQTVTGVAGSILQV